MMRRLLMVLSVAALLVMAALPALASQPSAKSPAQLCKSWYETRIQERPPDSGNEVEVTAYWVPLEYPFGVEELSIQTLGGCVTTVVNGGGGVPVPFDALSTAAINGQCRLLEQEGINYPYNFYGNPDYLAKNRADCVYFLRAFHLGELPPGPG